MVDYKANPVSKVSCMNCGAVIMDFCIKPDGGREPDIKSFRKQIKANQSKTIDVDELGLEDGHEFTIVVAICGHNKLVTTRQKLVYKCGCDETAYFRLTGTLCTAKIELVQLGTPRVSQIRCKNLGGFVMRFKAVWENSSTGYTDRYPIGKSKAISLRDRNISPGSYVWIKVDVFWGNTKETGLKVRYDRFGGTATYEVRGGTRNVAIGMGSE